MRQNERSFIRVAIILELGLLTYLSFFKQYPRPKCEPKVIERVIQEKCPVPQAQHTKKRKRS